MINALRKVNEVISGTVGNIIVLPIRVPGMLRGTFDPQLRTSANELLNIMSMLGVKDCLPKTDIRVTVERYIMIPMRDKVRLCAAVTRPTGDGRYPAIFFYHPYGRWAFDHAAIAIAKQGYVVVQIDERGRFRSEGEWDMFRKSKDDGKDICKWIVQQPWANGQIGGWGPSMLAINQCLTALDNELVTAVAPNLGCLDIRRLLHFNGARPLLTIVFMTNFTARRKTTPAAVFFSYVPSLYRKLPLSKVLHPSFGKIDLFEKFLLYDSYDPFFDEMARELDAEDGVKYSTISAPFFSVTGWYDMFCDTMIHDFQQLQATGSEAGRKSRLVIGPWGHYWSRNRKEAKEYALYSSAETLKWYEYIFRGASNGVEKWPPVRYYVTGADEWRSSDQWPPSGAKTSALFLSSEGNAGTSAEGGKLIKEANSSGKQPDCYLYNPADPVPTRGGNHLIFTCGRADQSKLEKRSDVLVYRTAVLQEPFEIAGPIEVVLFVSTNAPDTDFTAKLVDVCPDGKVWNLRDGIIRLRYREFPRRPMNEPAEVESGRVYKISIELGHMAHRFEKGHRIGLHVSSSNFPKYDRNLNTGENPYSSEAIRKAEQRVYHGKERPSRLLLTVP